jgi:four helix bundle protein
METSDWTFSSKPYDLRKRLFIFASAITRLVQYLHTCGPIAIELSAQLLACGTSAAANYEEADDGSSRRDRVAKTRIVLRELKEPACDSASCAKSASSPTLTTVIQESDELVKIVATIIRRSSSSSP